LTAWQKLQRPVSREKGVALIVVACTIAVLTAVLGDFSYNARVDLEAAANGRDQLRAEYLARSGIQLARLLIKVQQSVLDQSQVRKFIGDVQIGDFAPYLMKAFGGAADERAGLGSLLGIDTSQMKGLGVGKNATFDVVMTSDDGRLNLNCGGGLNDVPHQQQLYAILTSMFWPPRYNRMFETADSEGQYTPREDVARAIVDWADIDENKFDPTPGASSTSSEDYRYDAGRDPYKSHNNFFDSIEELTLVRGVSDDLWGSFGEMLTVYGGCKINLAAVRPENWPLVAAIIRATVKDDHKSDPTLLDDVLLAGLAQQIIGLAQLTGGFQSVSQFVNLISDPATALKDMTTSQGNSNNNQPPPPQMQGGVTGVPLDANKVNNVVTVGPRRTYRLDAIGTIQRTREKKIEMHIRGVWDSAHNNQNTTSADPNDVRGTWVYWRVD
jgi:type II secretory pathway component PulK